MADDHTDAVKSARNSWLNYFAPQAAQTWCGRFFSPQTLHTLHGITDKASCERRWALRDLLVLLLGVAILLSFYIFRMLILFKYSRFASKSLY